MKIRGVILLEDAFASIPIGTYWTIGTLVVVAGTALLFRYRSGTHAKEWLDRYGHQMPDKDYDNKLATLKIRATVPYAEPETFGTDMHFLFALAAVWNERRYENKLMIGGFHDRVKLVDPELGPVLVDDQTKLFQVMTVSGIEGGTALWNTLNAFLLGAIDGSKPHPLIGAEWPEHKHGTILDDGRRIPGFAELEIHMLAYSVHLCRIGATIGWLSDARAVEYLSAARDALVPRLAEIDSWREYGRLILRCENYYGETFQPIDPAAIEMSLKRLDQERYSPWKKMPFKIPEPTMELAGEIDR